MRWIRYETNGHPAYGIVEGDIVTEVKGDPFAGYERTTIRRPMAAVKLLTPVEPRTFYCAGLNYAEHVIEAARKRGQEPNLPQAADIGYRANNALIAHGEPIVIPADATERVQYEGELVAVIGRNAKHLSDTFKPMGPWIETDFNLDAAETRIRVNGAEKIRFKTNNMIFGPATFISRMSQYLTLEPGDVVWMGTEGAPENVKHGDTVEIEITGIGTLRNPVVRASR